MERALNRPAVLATGTAPGREDVADDGSGPGVYVFTTGPDSPFGIGEESPPESTTRVDVNGNTGYLGVSGGHRSLGWRLPDGTAAYVFAPSMSPDVLLAVGRSMALRADGQGWEVGHLPSGLVPVIDEENTRVPSVESHALTFAGEAGTVEVHSYRATRVDLESRIADYSVDAEVTNTTARGYPAAVARSPRDVRVLWYDDANRVANYLILHGPVAADVDEVVRSVTELSEDEWDELLATVDTPGQADPQSSTSSTSTP